MNLQNIKDLEIEDEVKEAVEDLKEYYTTEINDANDYNDFDDEVIEIYAQLKLQEWRENNRLSEYEIKTRFLNIKEILNFRILINEELNQYKIV